MVLLTLVASIAMAGASTAQADDHEPVCDGATLSAEAAVACGPAESAAAPAPAGASQHLARWLGKLSRSKGEGDGTRPAAQSPYRILYGAVFPFARIGVWAQGSGFALRPRSPLYDVRGGAALRFAEGVTLTACYRLLGVDFDSDVEAVDVEPGIAAPFVGLAFDF